MLFYNELDVRKFVRQVREERSVAEEWKPGELKCRFSLMDQNKSGEGYEFSRLKLPRKQSESSLPESLSCIGARALLGKMPNGMTMMSGLSAECKTPAENEISST